MDRKARARLHGYASLAGVLAAWAAFGVSFVRGVPPFFFRWIKEWLAVLAVAFVLALAAAVKGSPRRVAPMFAALRSLAVL